MSTQNEISQAAAAMGRVKSAAKAKASRANGALGGRPRELGTPIEVEAPQMAELIRQRVAFNVAGCSSSLASDAARLVGGAEERRSYDCGNSYTLSWHWEGGATLHAGTSKITFRP